MLLCRPAVAVPAFAIIGFFMGFDRQE